MLTQLTINNFGLIDSVCLEFNECLNVLTGETGAGKSIIIDALRIALGDRINPLQVRDKTKPCTIECFFVLQDKELINLEIFEDIISDENELIIHRSFSSEGRNKIKINGKSVTVSLLKEIGNFIVDFHGPHDHQMLLSPESHMGMLDRLIDFDGLLNDYQNIFNEYCFLNRKLQEITDLSQTRERELDLLSHQVKELEQVPLDDLKHEELLQAQIKVNNAEKISEYIGAITNLMDNESDGASENIRKAFSPMRSLNQIDDRTESFLDILNQIQGSNDQLLTELRNYSDGLSFDPHFAQQVSDQCDIYDDIIRKYGPTLEDAKKFYFEAMKKYDLLANIEQNDKDLRLEINNKEKELSKIAKKITQKRQKFSISLRTTIEKELSELGIANVEFESRVEKSDFGLLGQDIVTFYISPNAGEELKPLSEIVSSGEAARVMLALKKALIKVDPIPVLIFDEIDAQIGGRLGTITGQKLREISKNRQVLLITHLPQIASFGDIHFMVNKSVKNGRTITKVDVLDKNSRINEIAKMMSGEKESKIALKHASDMLLSASK